MISQILRQLVAPEEAPPWGLPAALISLAVLLISLIVGTLVLLTLMEPVPGAALLGWIVGSGVAVTYTWSAFRRSREWLRLGGIDARLFLILLFAIGMAMVIDLIDLGITGVFEPVPELMTLAGVEIGAAGWVTAVLWMLIAQPAAEELIFRGVLFPALRQTFGGWGGLLINGLLYGLFHLIAYTSEPGHLWHTFATPLLIGLVIGGVRSSTHSTRAALVAHIGFGVFALLKLLALG